MKRMILAGLSVAGALLLTACSNSKSSTPAHSSNSEMAGHSMPGMNSTSQSASDTNMAGMPMSSGDGLSATVNGYTLKLAGTPMAGTAMNTSFTITKNAQVVTAFDPEQTKLMHFYLIRSDLTGFQHLHPRMNAAGTSTVTPTALKPGHYRAYLQFVPHADAAAGALVLSAPLSVGGAGASNMAPLPAAGMTAVIDGYTVTVSGTPKAGTESRLSLTVRKYGKPVNDLQPYLATYAHLTAVHVGDLAFAHLHPDGAAATGDGGPNLTVHADLPKPGPYRMFIQFQTAGILHTATLTMTAA